MTNRKTLLHLAVAVGILIAAVPMFAATGKADFTTFVAFGDSWGMGISNGSLVATHQQYGWPAVIARQVGLNTNCTTDGPKCFQQPLISEPGLPGEMVLTSLSPVTFANKPGAGAPINLGLPRPYNNLSISGMEVADVLNIDGDGDEGTLGPLVLRGLGQVMDQGLRLKPTFVAIWVGGDDLFNAVQYGNARMTSASQFASDYKAMLDALTAGAPNAGIVVGNLPTKVEFAPFVTLIPPVIINPATGLPILDPTGKTIPYIADLGGGNFGQLPAGSLVTLYAKPYLTTGYGIPAALKPLIPLPDVGKPLPDFVTITPTELAEIDARAVEFNAAIQAAASSHNIPVVDVASFINRASAGIPLGGGTGITLNTSFITGGIVSYDGFHLTDIGETLFANEYIKTINAAYGTRIPLASFATLFANNGVGFIPESAPVTQTSFWDTIPDVSPEAPGIVPDIPQPQE